MTTSATSSSLRSSPTPVEGRWREILSSPTLRTWVLYVPLAFFSSTLAVAQWDARQQGGEGVDQASGPAMLLWFAGILLALSLAWRRRYPVPVAVITAVGTLLLPLDPVAALIGFGSLAVRRLDHVVAAVSALVGAAAITSTWRDGRGTSSDGSFWQMILAPPGDAVSTEPLSFWVVLAISMALLASSFGIAMLVRDRQRTHATREEGQAHRQMVAGLTDELARQAERERLAQEVHDALGHRLSLLSLHAGAVQLRAGEDPALRESAGLVRWGAEQAMTDLRSLLTMLRQPGGPDLADSIPTLRDMALLIDETSRTGVTLVSTVQLESLDELDDLTSRSAFRIAQELLTNARRHAAGMGVRILVRATPSGGVEIEAANHLPSSAAAEVAAGGGLSGIATRVEQLGGQWHCWVDEQRVFRAAAHLPWVPRRPDSPTAVAAAGIAQPAHGHAGTHPPPVPWQMGEETEGRRQDGRARTACR